jgi:cyclopropane fatty-acyl-phospholipid synthase-like methyltransferase
MTNMPPYPQPTQAYDLQLTDDMQAWLTNPAFPRTAKYDPAWVLENDMGPHVLWMTEWALEAVDIKPGMKVLDLGCGRGTSSIFLAREMQAQVWATDLWIPAEENEVRIAAAGLSDQITAMHAEAHALPYEEGFFDLIISIDAYQYFGTADLYLGTMHSLLKPGGQLAVVMPGVTRELPDGPPAHLKDYWDWEFCCFHTADWWQQHWAKTGLMQSVQTDVLEDGWKRWLEWTLVGNHARIGPYVDIVGGNEADMLRDDAGEIFCFNRVVARKGD